jgi:hypothetical protein
LGIDSHHMRGIILTTLIGILAGAIAGALILGIDQWFRERWQTDSAEIEKWVSIAVFMGASMGAIGGGLVGLIVGIAKSRNCSVKFLLRCPTNRWTLAAGGVFRNLIGPAEA